MTEAAIFTQPGSFLVGCNYWASHAGTHMWRDWRAESVEADFRRLAANGIQVLRVFPLWTDFQPISLLRGVMGEPVEYRFGEQPLPDTAAGRAGVDEQMISHFAEMARLAEQYQLQLVVGLVTGWMSGRLYVPPALEGLNVHTDPTAIMWQVRFVKYFVEALKEYPVIAAWDLGNECNCMARSETQAAAWNWSCAIADAIRSKDQSRPVISGMHGLKTQGVWRITDQAELTDILTTHPYTSPTYGSDRDPGNTIAPLLHPTANTLFYRGIGQKPCFVEECGTFGPMNMSERISADYARNNLFTLWAHDCRGFLWWCANEQSHLAHAPYDWTMMERELGLFRADGSNRPVLATISQFARFVQDFPYGRLPSRLVDAVCILPDVVDTWNNAYASFILAKQAGLDLEFQFADQPLQEAPLYLLPGTTGIFAKGISVHRMEALLEKVRAGAILYISMDGAVFDHFEDYAGVEVQTRAKSATADRIVLPGGQPPVELTLQGTYKLQLQVTHARVLAKEADGNPALTCANYGLGQVMFLRYPLERYVVSQPGLFHRPDAQPYWRIYRILKDMLQAAQIKSSGSTVKIAERDNPFVSLTEHPADADRRILVLINHKPEPVSVTVNLAAGWRMVESIYPDRRVLEAKTGRDLTVTIEQTDAAVLLAQHG